MQRLFLLALGFIVSLGAAIGVLLYVSLIPHFGMIGDVAAGLLIFCLICAAFLMGTFTWSRMGIMLADRRRARANQYLIVAGDIAAYLPPSGNLIHLSAMHEAAKIPPPGQIVNALPEPKDETEEKTVLELYNKGMALRDIVKATGATYYRVQKICAEKA